MTYLGKIKYKTEVHPGEHEGIVSEELWQRVQALLERNGRMGGPCARNKFGALLKGLLHCVPCGCGMSPTHATRNGTIRYRYYVCNNAQKRGWHNCPSRSIPAGEIERFVVEQIKLASQDPALLHEVVAQARVQGKSRLEELEAERRGLERELGTWSAEVRSLLDQIAPGDSNTPAIARLADLQERIRLAERRSTEVREQVIALGSQIVDQREVAQAMTVFDPVWESLTPREQTRVIHLLVQRVDYDGTNGKVSITFHPKGIKTLADDLASQNTENPT